MDWHEKHYNETINELSTDRNLGLKSPQAEENLRLYGHNKLNEGKKTNILVKFIMQFNDFMIVILLAAAAVSFLISFLEGSFDFVDPIIILLIVTLNAVLGLVQENKAEKTLEALKSMAAPTTKVIRNGHVIVLETEFITIGDIVILEAGDYIPADARLITSINLKIEESALTGESVPVEKDSDIVFKENSVKSVGDYKNMVFSGTSVSYGRGLAVVTAIGMQTEMGKIAKLLSEEEQRDTPLQKKLAHIGKLLGIGALIVCGFIFLIGLLRSIPPFEMFMTSISLAVAAIPEGLPAIVTIMLAIGVQRMAKKNAVIRKLPAVETLGSATVICSDKTGTLTQNKMKVVEIANHSQTFHKNDETRNIILRLATLCNDTVLENDGKKTIGDPTEAAIIHAALLDGLDKNLLNVEFPRISEVPFDSKRKLMTTIHRNEKFGYLIATKGAPEVLIDKCSNYLDNGKILVLDEQIKTDIKKQNAKMAGKALRVLGVAYENVTLIPSKINESTIEQGLTFAGLIGMIDPPREEAQEAVRICQKAGIKPVMVTGDHVITALAIANKIGITDSSGRSLMGEEISVLTDSELAANIHKYTVFARVSPEHKVRIVKAYQSVGNVVAMTGDGVNDAPALKAADIGCAMGISGTDVAKGAADMVLIDDNFTTIVDAVKEGRGIYENIKKAVHFLLSSNIGEIITIFVAILMGFATPLLAIHLLWVNLVTDSLPAIALGLDKPTDDIMLQKPFDNNINLFSGGLWQRIAVEGCMIGTLALLAFAIGTIFYDVPDGHEIGRTMCFATLSISQLVHAFNMRSEKSIFAIDIFSNIYLVGAFVVGVILQVSVIMIKPLASIFKVVPLSPECWLFVVFLCIVPIILVELEKLLARKRLKKSIA